MLQILGYMFGVYGIVRLAMETYNSRDRGLRTLSIFGILCLLIGMVWLTMQGAKLGNAYGLP